MKNNKTKESRHGERAVPCMHDCCTGMAANTQNTQNNENGKTRSPEKMIVESGRGTEDRGRQGKNRAQDIMDFKVHFIAYIAPKWIARCEKTQTYRFLHAESAHIEPTSISGGEGREERANENPKIR